jgi:hypothetical protein
MKKLLHIFTILLLAFYMAIPTQARESHQRKLRNEGIREYKIPIHDRSAEWLEKTFKDSYTKEGYPVNISLMMRNIIWQQRQIRKRKDTAPFKGNLRSFWYSYIKLPLVRLDVQKEDHYKLMIEQFTHLVKDKDLMRYKDIGFTDENKFSKITGENYQIILFAEKQGHYHFLVEMHNKYNITVISLGGQPSLLSAEYFVDDLKKRGINIRKKFHLFSIVDYDPSGWIIRNAFIEDLRFYGMKNLTITDLVWPELLTVEELKLRIYPVPNPDNMRTKNQKWLEATGGTEGNLLGLEADAIPYDVLETLLESKLKKLIKKLHKKQTAHRKRNDTKRTR